MNAYRTFDARVRAAARAATPSDRLLLLAEDLAVAVLSPGRSRLQKGNLTADERRAFLVEKLLLGGLGRRRAPSRRGTRGANGEAPRAHGPGESSIQPRGCDRWPRKRDALQRTPERRRRVRGRHGGQRILS